MTNLTTSEQGGMRSRKTQFLRRWGNWVRLIQRYKIMQKLEFLIAISALVSAVVTIAAVSQNNAAFNLNSSTMQALMLVNLVLMLILAAQIARWIVRSLIARKDQASGSRLHRKIVGFFSLIAVGPPILMAIFSALFFQFGIDAWFSEKVSSTLNNSLEVAEAYIDEHREVIRVDLHDMVDHLNRQAVFIQGDTDKLQQVVVAQAATRGLAEAIVFDSKGIILSRVSTNLSLSPERVSDDIMRQVSQGEKVIISDVEDDRVRAISKLDNYFDAYLYVSRFMDGRVLQHVQAARESINEYQTLSGQRSDIQIRFNMIFLIVGLLILMAAVWLGLTLAGQITNPISELVDASSKIGKGDLNVRVPVQNTSDEIGTLGRAFNRMTERLEEQQKDLIKANEVLDVRRRFTEAVLFGVSVGVLGLTLDGRITLVNRAASEQLALSPEELIGLGILDVIPEIAAVFDDIAEKGLDHAHGQVSFVRKNTIRTLLANITTQQNNNIITGYVVTFDDVTDRLADQRTAAWADVARRIAHEIKNPLTPIQLSAERLRRKYGREISTDPEVFELCTNTIIKQVGDLKRMVDEFSSFARMPAPVLREEDILDIVRQSVFLQQVSRHDIEYVINDDDIQLDKLVCDGRLIAQALTNLLKNASEAVVAFIQRADAGGAEGLITVDFETSEKSLDIIIRDNGAGIPQEVANRITEPYVTTRAKGTGLGLAIVRKIMEDHGGSLTIQNKENGRGAKAILHFDLLSLTENDSEQKEEPEQAYLR